MVAYHYNHWRIVSQLKICSFRASRLCGLAGKVGSSCLKTPPKTRSPPQNASDYRSVTCQHPIDQRVYRVGIPFLLVPKIYMRCDPCRASLQQFDLQYPFRYYSSISQPHCFSVRLSVILLALTSGPPHICRAIMRVSHVCRTSSERHDRMIHNLCCLHEHKHDLYRSQHSFNCFPCRLPSFNSRHHGVTFCML